MIFPKEFFDLQFAFAERVQVLAGVALERALLEYTNLYVRFGCGRQFDPAHDVWRAYLAGLAKTDDPRGWTHRFYLADAERNTAPPLVSTVGCFSYALQEPGVVRLHFQNADRASTSPLHETRAGRRRAELRTLVTHVRGRLGDDVFVTGTSWLYNLEAYRRLFPAAYTSSSEVVRRFRSMPLWGQFVDYRGRIKTRPAEDFAAALARQSTLDELPEAFPLQPLAARAPLRPFLEFYGIES